MAETRTRTPEPVAVAHDVDLPRALTVKELADRLRLTPVDIIKELMKNGIMATINQVIDYDTAAIVASDLGFEVTESAPAEPAASTPTQQEGPRNVHIVEDGPDLVS